MLGTGKAGCLGMGGQLLEQVSGTQHRVEVAMRGQ